MCGVIYISRMERLMLYLLLVTLILWSQPSFARECNPGDELPCLTKQNCIHKMQWCDRVINCPDSSDEYFCNAPSCPENLFRCENGKCIPGEARCDGFDNCGDGSDERCPRPAGYTVDSLSISDLDMAFYEVTSPNATDAVTKAAKYLLGKRELDNGWHNFTPRAVVALAFSEKAGKIPVAWISSLKKELNIKVLLNLKQRNMEPRLCDLAHYINALLATCEDPRNFQGVDLVKRLRSEVDTAEKMDLPFVYLTLCISGYIEDEDTRQLLTMYDRMGDDRIGSKALILMALKCISNSRQGVFRRLQRKIQYFMRDANSIVSTNDIYTKALYYQALNAFGYESETDLLTHQHPDGSFGDLLATYYAIPALLNKSLLDLKCKNSEYEAMQMMAGQLPNYDSDEKKVTYSLWIDQDSYVNTHSMIMTLNGNKTLYDVMKMAEAKNSIFNFLYDPSSDGKKIYSLAGIPNDAEIGKEWTLYRGKENIMINLKRTLSKQELGVDRIFPRGGEHFVFWFERSVG